MKELALALVWFVFGVCPVVALLFFIRIIVASFSTRTSGQIRRHPVIHIVWGCLAFLGVLVFLGVLNPNMWPMSLIQRHYQREEVVKRVQSGGGWGALQKDCEALAEQYREDSFIWYRWNSPTNLPPSIDALHPMEVHFDSPKHFHESNEPPFSVVQIKIFGAHATGGHPIPKLWLEVVCGTNAESYPKPTHGYNRMTDRIYEVY